MKQSMRETMTKTCRPLTLWLLGAISAPCLALTLSLAPPYASVGADTGPGWRKHTISDRSPFEAAGAADFNGDGKLDVFSGDSWYEAPGWKRHKVRTLSKPNPHYELDFADCPLDVNGDGKTDIVTCTYFSGEVGWVEHPGDPTLPWTEHTIAKPGSSECGELVDLNGDGVLDFLPNSIGLVVWYELVAKKPQVKWKEHVLGKEGAGHGVGYGDVNRDGRVDVLCPRGWYEQPQNGDEAWPFHQEFELGAMGIYTLGRDFDGDGDTDIVWGLGHDYGLRWLKQERGEGGARKWVREDIDLRFSQVHTQTLADLDGDGEPEVVTGKRVYAHETDAGATDAPCVYSFRFDRKERRWERTAIYEGQPAAGAPKDGGERDGLKDFERGSVGTGLQMQAVDMDGDGDLDLLCPGKTGLYWLENLRAAR